MVLIDSEKNDRGSCCAMYLAKEQLDWIYLAIDMRHILPKVVRVIQSCIYD
jgi:hypothetical protein